MSKHGYCGRSFGQICNDEKEAIIMAYNGKVKIGEDDIGDVWGTGTKEQCQKVIVDAFDNVVYQALSSMHSGRALEYLLKQEHGENYEMPIYDYLNALEKTEMKHDYHYSNGDED